MKKQKRLRRRIEKPDEDKSQFEDDTSPIACIDCHQKYEMITGSSNVRCKSCNEKYKSKIGYYRIIR